MTIAAPSPPTSTEPVSRGLHRFTVKQYHRMIEVGVFSDRDPVELLEGWIVDQMGHNPPHDVVVKLVSLMLDRAIPDRFHSRVQSAVTLADSEPLPDVAVVAGSVRDYITRHPGPADIALLVEVSDASIDRDQGQKVRLYARAMVPAYWIINLQAAIVEVHTQPTGPAATPQYQKVERFGPNDAIPLTVAGQALPPIRVKEILP
jgi:Uma2 family endonuclease